MPVTFSLRLFPVYPVDYAFNSSNNFINHHQSGQTKFPKLKQSEVASYQLNFWPSPQIQLTAQTFLIISPSVSIPWLIDFIVSSIAAIATVQRAPKQDTSQLN